MKRDGRRREKDDTKALLVWCLSHEGGHGAGPGGAGAGAGQGQEVRRSFRIEIVSLICSRLEKIITVVSKR